REISDPEPATYTSLSRGHKLVELAGCDRKPDWRDQKRTRRNRGILLARTYQKMLCRHRAERDRAPQLLSEASDRISSTDCFRFGKSAPPAHLTCLCLLDNKQTMVLALAIENICRSSCRNSHHLSSARSHSIRHGSMARAQRSCDCSGRTFRAQ